MSKELEYQAWRERVAESYTVEQFRLHGLNAEEYEQAKCSVKDHYLAGMSAEAPIAELRGYARAMREIQCREMQISGDMPKEPEAQYHSVEGYCSMAAQTAEAQLARLLEKGEENGKV